MDNAQKESAPAGGAQQSSNQHFNHTESPAAKLLPRLDKVKETGRGQYLACCPAHDDKNPSLTIKEAADGTLLIKCWAGCEALEIVHATGLELRDLFPQRYERRPMSRYERRFNPRDVLAALAYEATVITVIASDIKERNGCDDETFNRLATATRRIGEALEVCR